MVDSRLTLRRRHSYNTTANRVRKVKTPGGRLVLQYIQKRTKGVRCGDCHGPIAGIPHLKTRQYATASKRVKSVTRAYGGNRCATCVRERIVRAFLIEEQKIVKKVLKAHQQTKKSAQ
mmetsp:Transcript_14989/g.20965  ORF Transcript_14989/g.20965 Transcript_14989/m.20965 type:complete len:118 (+) Transcript_14989:81-434(+)|eukprot:CAMPEP_0168540370 /NCGR_PEP_ID=MMETSP0413-20121227/242_1 /TAXON_ID=136452 /ORGANISM="Filamoeba nolandi, Strain NC-AS-23-1" /LENGTH=117 /DNA_ID=CAMNT_0008570103 /DNA_START=77 /DNA_END=430 /DNA_ORIENTATION=+